jgi:proline racemase
VDLPGFGPLSFDLVWGGVFYALVKADDLDLALTQKDVPRLAEIGAELVEAARPLIHPSHPNGGDEGPLSFVLFAGSLRDGPKGLPQALQAAYVHPGVICRSPTGTGTAAQMAWRAARGELGPGSRLETFSPFHTVFHGKILSSEELSGLPAITTKIGAQAFTLARSKIFVDFSDPLVAEGGLRSILLG